MKFFKLLTFGQIFGLCSIILIVSLLQMVNVYWPVTETGLNSEQILVLKKIEAELSAHHILQEKNKQRLIYPFNPNFISDYKGYILGMSVSEIDRLNKYRAKDLWINSTSDFKKVTLIIEERLSKFSHLFKFPEFINRKKDSNIFQNSLIDLNVSKAKSLQQVNGIGPVLSQRIVDFRNQLGGFTSLVQLGDIYGITPELIDKIKKRFHIPNPLAINTMDLNIITVNDLVTIPHIDYEIAYEIIDYRILNEGFNNLQQLTNVNDFPTQKIDIIKLYLHIKTIQ